MRIMSLKDYHSSSAISKSGLDQIAKSPEHFKLYKTSPREPSYEMEFGSAFHALVLEPETFERDFVVVDASTKNTKIFTSAAEANPGKIVLLQKEKDQLVGMRDSFMNNPTVSKVVENSLVERSIFWKDPITGVECRCRPDLIFDGHILIDLKSTVKDPREYAYEARKYRSHVQSAFYMAGYFAETGIRAKEFLFITVEKSAPYGIVTYRATESFIQAGVEAMHKDLATYARCLETGRWPGYSEDIQDLSLPSWAV